MPTAAGAAPERRQPPADTTGPLLLEHLSEYEGWAVLTAAGRQVNPFLRTAPALAYYLAREKLTKRVTNLDALGSELLQNIAKGVERSKLWS